MRCRKVRYADRAAAWGALDELDAKRSHSKKESTAYFCHRCKGWHLTAQIRRRWTGRATG